MDLLKMAPEFRSHFLCQVFCEFFNRVAENLCAIVFMYRISAFWSLERIFLDHVVFGVIKGQNVRNISQISRP